MSLPVLDLSVDAHCHTDVSDDATDPLDAVLDAADRRGLTRLSITEHVRSTTTWLPEYVAGLARAAAHTGLDLVCGVEAKILDTEGRVDLPTDLRGVVQVTVSDHQFPTAAGPVSPQEMRSRLESGVLTAADALEQLVLATSRAVLRYETPVVGHLFSILPKVGIDPAEVTEESLAMLADACARVGGAVEVNEKWATPALPAVTTLARLGVRLVPGSDAHRAADVGRYTYVAEIARTLEAGP